MQKIPEIHQKSQSQWKNCNDYSIYPAILINPQTYGHLFIKMFEQNKTKPKNFKIANWTNSYQCLASVMKFVRFVPKCEIYG